MVIDEETYNKVMKHGYNVDEGFYVPAGSFGNEGGILFPLSELEDDIPEAIVPGINLAIMFEHKDDVRLFI